MARATLTVSYHSITACGGGIGQLGPSTVKSTRLTAWYEEYRVTDARRSFGRSRDVHCEQFAFTVCHGSVNEIGYCLNVCVRTVCNNDRTDIFPVICDSIHLHTWGDSVGRITRTNELVRTQDVIVSRAPNNSIGYRSSPKRSGIAKEDGRRKRVDYAPALEQLIGKFDLLSNKAFLASLSVSEYFPIFHTGRATSVRPAITWLVYGDLFRSMDSRVDETTITTTTECFWRDRYHCKSCLRKLKAILTCCTRSVKLRMYRVLTSKVECNGDSLLVSPE
ncbi:hypothetical protein CBL_05547 [Carabus blaptoides fortunei]